MNIHICYRVITRIIKDFSNVPIFIEKFSLFSSRLGGKERLSQSILNKKLIHWTAWGCWKTVLFLYIRWWPALYSSNTGVFSKVFKKNMVGKIGVSFNANGIIFVYIHIRLRNAIRFSASTLSTCWKAETSTIILCSQKCWNLLFVTDATYICSYILICSTHGFDINYCALIPFISFIEDCPCILIGILFIHDYAYNHKCKVECE